MTARDQIIDYVSEVIQAKVIVLSKTDIGYLYKFKKTEYEFQIYLFSDYEPYVEGDIQCMAHVYQEGKKIIAINGTIDHVMSKLNIF